jgi:hypothetical protein
MFEPEIPAVNPISRSPSHRPAQPG